MRVKLLCPKLENETFQWKLGYIGINLEYSLSHVTQFFRERKAKLKEDWKLSVSLRQGRFAECLLTWKQPSRWFVIIVQLQRQQGYIYWTDSWWALRCVLRTQLSQAPLCYLVDLSVWVKEDYKIVSVATSCQYMEEGMRRLKTIQMCFRYRFL